MNMRIVKSEKHLTLNDTRNRYLTLDGDGDCGDGIADFERDPARRVCIGQHVSIFGNSTTVRGSVCTNTRAKSGAHARL